MKTLSRHDLAAIARHSDAIRAITGLPMICIIFQEGDEYVSFGPASNSELIGDALSGPWGEAEQVLFRD